MGLIAIMLFLSIVSFLIAGSFVAMADVDSRRAAWKAGTHDYYGNKIEKNTK